MLLGSPLSFASVKYHLSSSPFRTTLFLLSRDKAVVTDGLAVSRPLSTRWRTTSSNVRGASFCKIRTAQFASESSLILDLLTPGRVEDAPKTSRAASRDLRFFFASLRLEFISAIDWITEPSSLCRISMAGLPLLSMTRSLSRRTLSAQMMFVISNRKGCMRPMMLDPEMDLKGATLSS